MSQYLEFPAKLLFLERLSYFSSNYTRVPITYDS